MITTRQRYFIVLCLMLAACLLQTACSQAAGNKSNPDVTTITGEAEAESSGPDPAYTADLPDMDFQDAAFTILLGDTGYMANRVYIEEQEGSMVDDAVYNRNIAVEESCGITLDVIANGTEAMFRKAVSAGDSAYNLVWLPTPVLISDAQNGLLLDLYSLEYLNPSKSYWDQGVVRDLSVYGKLFGLLGDICTQHIDHTHIVLFNKTLAENYNLPDMYQIVHDGKWDFETFGTLMRSDGASQDINGDGKMDHTDQYSMVITQDAYNAFFAAAGEKWIEKDENDTPYLTELTDRKVKVLEWIQDTLCDRGITLNAHLFLSAYKDSWAIYDLFPNGRALFTDVDVNIMQAYNVMDDDFGLLPQPAYNAESTYYGNIYFYTPMLGVPATAAGEAADMTGYVMEALAWEGYRIITPAYYDTAIANRYLRDTESIGMLDYIVRNRAYDMAVSFSWGNLVNDITSQLNNRKLNIASLYESKTKMVNKAIENFIASFSD
jgi:hypothetical protein